MDYKSFDQSPPNGGWRALKDKGRDLEIANLLDSYAKCRKGLTSDQKGTIIFHAGQIHANIGESEKALERFAESYNDELNSKYHWNLFVDGTMAFVKRDAAKLKAARDKVEALEKDHPYVKTLNNLMRCFGRPYKLLC